MSKYVLMSGGTSGIGKSAAMALARRGYTVFAGALSQHTMGELDGVGDGRIVPILLDVTNRETIDRAIATVRERIGPQGNLHALISNAGVDYNGPLENLSTDEIVSMVQVNLLGAILLSRAALALMRAGESRLVFVGSAMGLWATPMVSVYCSTKWGLEGFSDALRVELGMRNIWVTLVEPGVVQTAMTVGGAETMQRVLGRMDSSQRAIYEKLMRKIVTLSSALGAGITAEAVAEVIMRVIDAERPRSRYRVGKDSRVVGFLRHFPDAWRDFIMRKGLGL